MAYALTGKQATGMILDELETLMGKTYAFHDAVPSAISMVSGSSEMLRVAHDGFYVRGVKVPADEHEAETVYLSFKQWLAWANLQR
jgi:hypothetical protein